MVELLLAVEQYPYHFLEELEHRPHLVVVVEKCRFDLVEHLEIIDLLLDEVGLDHVALTAQRLISPEPVE